MNFFKNVLATMVGIILFSMLSFFLLFIVGIAVSASSESTVSVKNNSVIKLDLFAVTNDYGGKTRVTDFEFSEKNNDGLIDVLNAIEFAKTDSSIKGISIENNASMLGITQRKAIREKLMDFKKTGKFVVAYSDGYSQSEYYMNSVADTVYLNPMGSVDFKGLASEILYMKDLQEKSGVKMEVIRHGKYKSAVEPYLQQTMSEENREQMTVLLNSIWDNIITDISTSRKISKDSLNLIATNLEGRTPELALKNKLIDKIAYFDEYENGMRKAMNIEKDKEINKVDILDYVSSTFGKSKNKSKDRIAVIVAQGEIRGGEGSVNIIGEGSINRALKEARTNENIKAIVLRVNSPGGSALTSDIIWREIELTKKVKPVIVSMGDVAASGGYYIACNATRIFAEPTTITGSIGVFGVLPNFKGVTDKIGVNAQVVKTHKNAAGYSVFTDLDEGFKETIQADIERVYSTFVNRVAAGRNMTYEKVDALAQGRVWTGTMALENGLVDELGGLDAAVAFAAKEVGLTDYRINYYPEYEIKLRDLLRGLIGMNVKEAQQEAIIQTVGKENYELFERLNYIKETKTIQAMLPYQINIK
ncbi:signal peptide peptidase SppA [Paenimyroides tangerinum]|uniref:Signal peptide peptidase SppA n=1 Tax=Paenimyroides tangerinum TaxID=2488728 RepID=A0A3P3WDN7_9FLAO|nr:signal peptide peptidase SppA [Paenimyroides tangerinum]RRJ93271.1 signal peptide peptidase SppA [Paenimyroides tangerinum]